MAIEIRTGLVPFRHAPFGLARRFQRPAEPPPDGPFGTAEAAPPAEPAPPPPAAPEPAREPSTLEPPSLPVPHGVAPSPELAPRAEVSRLAPRKRRLRGATAETLPVRRKVADGLGLVGRCDAKACRRAKRCLGVRGAACLPDRPELDEALRAIRQAHEHMRKR